MYAQSPQQWLYANGLSSAAWLRMDDLARRRFVAVRRFGDVRVQNSVPVLRWVGGVNATCGVMGIAPAGQAQPPQTVTQSLGAMTLYVAAAAGVVALAVHMATRSKRA